MAGRRRETAFFDNRRKGLVILDPVHRHSPGQWKIVSPSPGIHTAKAASYVAGQGHVPSSWQDKYDVEPKGLAMDTIGTADELNYDRSRARRGAAMTIAAAQSRWVSGLFAGLLQGLLQVSCMALVMYVMLASLPLPVTAQAEERLVEHPTLYRTQQVDGFSIFYREAGPKDALTLLLLHGFPSSSRMFEPLLARLSDRFHLVAPDYPGFGHSDWPDPRQFAYTFDHIASVINDFTRAIGLSHYTLYVQDYGGPVGFRIALAHPDEVQALIVQNAVAHNEGLGRIWETRRAFWTNRPAHEEALRENFLSFATTKSRHIGGDPNIELYDPDLWTDEHAFLNAPGQAQIQTDLFYDYRTNVAAYPSWQAWLQKVQPRLLVLWGKHDPSFDIGEPQRYRKDVPNAAVHVLDAGHFALDTKADEIAALMRDFMQGQK
jgi:pimeloyl-ACP methyl ester carboxylesterase